MFSFQYNLVDQNRVMPTMQASQMSIANPLNRAAQFSSLYK